MKKLKTADGTETLYNEEFGEAYHSTKAGAYMESLHKFVIPCRIKELALEKEQIHILDVGFGLGYNVAVAVNEALEINPNIKLKIVSIEKDKNFLEHIKSIETHKRLNSFYDWLFKGSFKEKTLGKERFLIYSVQNENIDLEIYIGEGRKIIKNFVGFLDMKFNVVFFDPFSPKVNSEMWTLNLFKLIKNLIEEDGILATYSASLSVRKGLIEAGFKIGLVEPIGRKSYSTVATINGKIPPLTEKEKYRLENSPYAVPFIDNENLSLNREEIKKRWEEKIKGRLGKS